MVLRMERPAHTEPMGAAPKFPVRALLAVVAFAVFVIVMNGSMTNVALPTIGEEFGRRRRRRGG
ncbi:MAG: hypothetical protein M3Q49_16240 [Actinomycetota bacterium]|nr:hypothetical protein [Actinomycetota bacterium]